MEGFWTVQFKGIQGMGFGVITLIAGQVLGGDSAFLYTGTYKQNGNGLHARVHVMKYAPGMFSVMDRDVFDLELDGTMQVGGTLKATGIIPGTPCRFEAVITKRSELPARV